MKFSVATNWDDDLIYFAKTLNNTYKRNQIFEFFGSIQGSGVAIEGQKKLTKETIEKKIKLIKSLGFSFNYVANSLNLSHVEIDSLVRWINEINVDIVTVSNIDIVDYMHKHYPHINIAISIITGIRDINHINQLIHKYDNIKRIILNQSINRDKQKLEQHIFNMKNKNNYEIELLGNEICLYNCPKMNEHYEYISSIKDNPYSNCTDKWDSKWCCNIRNNNILHFLNSTWIRPEDSNLYESMGMNYLKLAGRGETTDKLKLIIHAYMAGKYKGNVMDLFIDAFWINKKPPFLDNSLLDNFIENLWKEGKTTIEKNKNKKLFYSYKENNS